MKVENVIPAPVCVSPRPLAPDKQRDSAAWLIKLDETLLSSLPSSILWSGQHNKLTNLNWPSFTLGGTFLLFKYKQLDRMACPAPSTGSD